MREGAPTSQDGVARQHQFRALPHDQQIQAIGRLSIIGHADEAIASTTGLTVQQIRTLLREARQSQRISR